MSRTSIFLFIFVDFCPNFCYLQTYSQHSLTIKIFGIFVFGFRLICSMYNLANSSFSVSQGKRNFYELRVRTWVLSRVQGPPPKTIQDRRTWENYNGTQKHSVRTCNQKRYTAEPGIEPGTSLLVVKYITTDPGGRTISKFTTFYCL